MRPRTRHGVRWSVAVACCVPPLAGWAAEEPAGDWAEWDVSATNTLRVERVNLRGPGLGPFPFAGTHAYDEASLTMTRAGLYDLTRFQLSGVANGSDYRSPWRGLVPERIFFGLERGDTALPFRAEAGDVFAYFTYRTLQRPLKGAQVELQPAPLGAWRQSLQFVAGVNELSWRQLDGHDRTVGASWLLDDDQRRGRIGLHVVSNQRDADAALGTLRRDQQVFSITGDRAIDVAGQRLRGEAEVAWFRGDHDGLLGLPVASGQGRRDTGTFAQLTGSPVGSPLGYRFRFERYGADFRPAGGLVTPDHQGTEAHVSWRTASGLVWRGRLLDYKDDLESGNRLLTRSAGLNLAGPLGPVSTSVDLLRDRQRRDDRSVDLSSWNLMADATAPIVANWLAQGTLQLQHTDDHNVPGGSTRRRLLRASLVGTWMQAGWFGTVSPGLSWRRETGPGTDLRETSPTLVFTAMAGPHQLTASWGQQRLRSGLAPTGDTTTQTAGLAWRYQWGLHQFGAEWGRYQREVAAPGNDNRTNRIALSWVFNFDKPATVRRGEVGFTSAAAPTGPLTGELAPIIGVAPGAPLDVTLQRLAAAGVRGGVAQGPWTVFEHRLLNEVGQRQRVVVEARGGNVERMTLVISPDDFSAQGLARTYEAVRKAMIDRLGPATMVHDLGDFTGQAVIDMAAGRLVRAMDWQTPHGLLRLGIPRRSDGQLRIEFAHAASLPPARNTAWGLDALR